MPMRFQVTISTPDKIAPDTKEIAYQVLDQIIVEMVKASARLKRGCRRKPASEGHNRTASKEPA